MKMFFAMCLAFLAMVAGVATAKTDHTGCELVPIMSELTPGKVLYYNYADPTCRAPEPGTRLSVVGFDTITGAPIVKESDR